MLRLSQDLIVRRQARVAVNIELVHPDAPGAGTLLKYGGSDEP